jgi:hypothetical protein
MTRPEAESLVARLRASFPAGNADRRTLSLLVDDLVAYEFDLAQAAIENLRAERREAWMPTWAEVRQALDVEQRRRRHTQGTVRPEPEHTVGPTQEFYDAQQRLSQEAQQRSHVLRHDQSIDHDQQRRRVRDKLDQWRRRKNSPSRGDG